MVALKMVTIHGIHLVSLKIMTFKCKKLVWQLVHSEPDQNRKSLVWVLKPCMDVILRVSSKTSELDAIWWIHFVYIKNVFH